MSTDTYTPLRPAVSAGLLQRVRASRWAPLPVVLAGTFMVVLDFFIVNVALPSIQSQPARVERRDRVDRRGLRADVGRVPDHRGPARRPLGRRRMFSLGLALFTLSLGGLRIRAGTPTVLVDRRASCRGSARALLMPNVLSIISVTLQRRRPRSRAARPTGS